MILALSPHTDDAELGCGGTLARFTAEGLPVQIVAFSCPDPRLAKESAHAAAALGAPGPMILGYPRRRLHEHRQEILDRLLALSGPYEQVFIPSAHDTHQDHQVIHAEAVRAFRQSTVLAYELPWNHLTFQTQAFVTLSEDDMARKRAALTAYQSQTERPYFAPDYADSLARVRGVQVGTRYAEAFEVVRWVR